MWRNFYTLARNINCYIPTLYTLLYRLFPLYTSFPHFLLLVALSCFHCRPIWSYSWRGEARYLLVCFFLITVEVEMSNQISNRCSTVIRVKELLHVGGLGAFANVKWNILAFAYYQQLFPFSLPAPRYYQQITSHLFPSLDHLVPLISWCHWSLACWKHGREGNFLKKNIPEFIFVKLSNPWN